MRLEFGPDDEDAFDSAKISLLDRFQASLANEGDPAAVAGKAGLALDWKWAYGDGHLGRWTKSEIREFLLDWCPRKLSVPPAECRTIPASLAAFTAFLADAGLLAPGSSPVDDLAATAVDITDSFLAAMGDASNFGMAKSLFASATADGVDMSDPDALQNWIAEFNARPEEERRGIIPHTAPAAPRRPAMPPVVPPDDSEVAAARAAAPILAKFTALVEFVGGGRKLTQKGNFTLADARVLVGLLGTGDVMDPRIGDRTFKTTSSAELWGLRQIFAWARKAGVVRVAHGRVHATKKGLAISNNPAAFFDRAVDALLAVGPLASQRDADGWLAWPEVTHLLDRFTLPLLTGPYLAQRPLPTDLLCQEATDAVLETFEFPHTTGERVARRVGIDVVDIVDALELAGMVRRTGAADSDDDALPRRRLGGSVELTAAGVVTTRRLLEEAGYEAPTTGRFTEATATELLLGTDPDNFAALAAEIEAWRRRRSPEQAAAELAGAVRAVQDPALANVALAVMAEIDLRIAGPEVRKLAGDPATRGFALCWLVDRGLEDPGALFDPDDVSWFVDVLAQRVVTLGPEGLSDTLALAGDHGRQIAVIGRLWRLRSPATEFVLAAIGELHPVKPVAKAARKALFQRRSWNGPF
ncbi:MAG: hypothetical protein ACR2KK_06765 [Acidimicrobiales bacterium]